MKYNRIFISTTEFLCVAALALCGVTAFANSGAFAAIEKRLPADFSATFLSLILFLVILAVGVFFIVIKNKNSGLLTVIVSLLCLPSVFSYNNIDLIKIFGGSTSMTTEMTLVQMISLGSLIVCSYFLLDLLHQLKLNMLRFKINQAPPGDLQEVVKNQHLLAIIMTGTALAFSLAITGIARGFEFLITRNPWALSWWIVPMAIFCITVLGVYLYWVTTRNNN